MGRKRCVVAALCLTILGGCREEEKPVRPFASTFDSLGVRVTWDPADIDFDKASGFLVGTKSGGKAYLVVLGADGKPTDVLIVDESFVRDAPIPAPAHE